MFNFLWFFFSFLFGRLEICTFQLQATFPVHAFYESFYSVNCFKGTQCASRLDSPKLCLLSFLRYPNPKPFLLGAWHMQCGNRAWAESGAGRTGNRCTIFLSHFTVIIRGYKNRHHKREDPGLRGRKERENAFKNSSSLFDLLHIYCSTQGEWK